MKLVEKGILKLDQKPFAKGGLMDIPEFSEIKDKRVRDITIEELLRHRGGFSRRGGDPMFIPNIIRNRMKLDSAPKQTTLFVMFSAGISVTSRETVLNTPISDMCCFPGLLNRQQVFHTSLM